MIHIVFEQANVDALNKAIELDETLRGEVVEIKDDFAVGPVSDIYETEGYQARRDWWMNALEFSPYKDQLDIVDDKMTVHQLIKKLEEPIDEKPEELWIWMGQNQHDVCSYYWLMSQLKPYQSRVHVLYLNNLPFINEKGQIFYPQHLHEIQPKEFLKAKKLARPITLSEFELDPDEWKKICDENKMVRILEGGKKIVNKDADYFDKELLSHVTGEPQKLLKVLGNAQSKMKVRTGDVFLVSRYKEMASNGMLEISGNWEKGWKELTIKFASNNSDVENN